MQTPPGFIVRGRSHKRMRKARELRDHTWNMTRQTEMGADNFVEVAIIGRIHTMQALQQLQQLANFVQNK